MGWFSDFTDNVLGIDDSGGLLGSGKALLNNPLKFFQYATGSATEGGKQFTNEVDDFVNDVIPGGWVTVAVLAGGTYLLMNPATGASAFSGAPAATNATAGQIAAAGGTEAIAAGATNAGSLGISGSGFGTSLGGTAGGSTLGASNFAGVGLGSSGSGGLAALGAGSGEFALTSAGLGSLGAGSGMMGPGIGAITTGAAGGGGFLSTAGNWLGTANNFLGSPVGQIAGDLLGGGLSYFGDKAQAENLEALGAQNQALTEAYAKGSEITEQQRLQAIENYRWELSKNAALSEQEKEQALADYEKNVSSATGAGYQALGQKFEGEGAEYRKRLSDLYNDPSSFLSSAQVQQPLQQGTDMLARSLSTGGNPIGSGNALQELQGFTSNQLFGRLGEEKGRLANLGYENPFYRAAPGAYNSAVAPTAAGSVGYTAPLKRTNSAPLNVPMRDPAYPYAGPSATAGQFALAGANKTGDMYGGLAEMTADIFKPVSLQGYNSPLKRKLSDLNY